MINLIGIETKTYHRQIVNTLICQQPNINRINYRINIRSDIPLTEQTLKVGIKRHPNFKNKDIHINSNIKSILPIKVRIK